MTLAMVLKQIVVLLACLRSNLNGRAQLTTFMRANSSVYIDDVQVVAALSETRALTAAVLRWVPISVDVRNCWLVYRQIGAVRISDSYR